MGIGPWQLLIVGAVVTLVRPQTPSQVISFTTPVQTQPPGVTLYGGTYIDLLCDPVVDETAVAFVNFTWTGPPGETTITGNDEFYTITNEPNNSILRIESLDRLRDDGAVYTCSVSATLNSGFDSDTSLQFNSSLTLSVNDLAIATFVHDVFIPDTPTAGDNFTIHCILTEPERLVIVPTLTWEVEIDSAPPVEVEDAGTAFLSGVTIGNTTAAGSGVFSRALSFTSIRTSHARRYSCEVFISGIVSEGEFGDLEIQIPPPAVTIAVSPAVDPIYSSTAINLICTAVLAEEVDTATMAMATWTGPTDSNDGQGQQPTDPDRISVMPAVSVGERMFESVLVFNPVDSEEDIGLHVCEMTIISNTGFSIEDPLILNGINTGDRSIGVESLPDKIPIVSITASGSGEVGQPFNLSCNVTIVERMVVSPGIDYNITWMKMDSVSQGEIGKDINITTVTEMADPTTTVTLIFDPLRMKDRGTYTCMAEFNITTTFDAGDESAEIDIIVDLPPVDVEVSMDYGDPLYAGTNLTLICSIDLDEDLVDIPVNPSTSWTKNDVPVTTDSTHSEQQPSLVNPLLHMYAATYSFTPLDDKFNSTDSSDEGDNGTYRCDLMVTPDVTDTFVRPISNSSSSDFISVLALPPPVVEIVIKDDTMIGEPLDVTCFVDVVDRLIVEPEIEWEKSSCCGSSISVTPLRVGNNSTLSFTPLKSSDAGQYTCRASITSERIGIIETALTGEDARNITAQIPAVVVTLTHSREGQQLEAGKMLVMAANISVDSNVDTPHTVTAVWDRNGTILSSSQRVNIPSVFRVEDGTNQYQAQIVFYTLSSAYDSGIYTCTVQVDSNSTYTYITSTSDTGSIPIDVDDPTIETIADPVAEFAQMETIHNYADMFVGLNLTCTANKSVEVIPELGVIWLRDGNLIEGSAEYTNGENVVTTTVMLTPAEFEDANYTCLAELIVPESHNVTNTNVLEVFFKGSRYEIFQLKIAQFSQCENKTIQPSILTLTRSRVTEAIRDRCECEFQEYLIDQSVLDCDESDAVFRAIIFSSAAYMDVSALVRFIEDWVQEGPIITIGDSMLVFDRAFPITDSSCTTLDCVMASPSPTPPPSESDFLVIIVAVAGAAAVVLLLVICVVTIVAVRCYMKRKQKALLASPKGEVQGTKFLFAEPIEIGEPPEKYEMSDKPEIANGGNEANGEVASNASHPDQNDPVVNQYNSLGKKDWKFAEPFKLEEPDAFPDNFDKATSKEEPSTTDAAAAATNHE